MQQGAAAAAAAVRLLHSGSTSPVQAGAGGLQGAGALDYLRSESRQSHGGQSTRPWRPRPPVHLAASPPARSATQRSTSRRRSAAGQKALAALGACLEACGRCAVLGPCRQAGRPCLALPACKPMHQQPAHHRCGRQRHLEVRPPLLEALPAPAAPGLPACRECRSCVSTSCRGPLQGDRLLPQGAAVSQHATQPAKAHGSTVPPPSAAALLTRQMNPTATARPRLSASTAASPAPATPKPQCTASKWLARGVTAVMMPDMAARGSTTDCEDRKASQQARAPVGAQQGLRWVEVAGGDWH